MIQTNKAVYAATLKDFLVDVKKNKFIEAMKEGSRKLGIPENDSQIRAWNDYGSKNSLRPLFEKMPDDVVVCFEYQVPVGGRIDCMLFGKDKNGKSNAIHIELKQWSNKNVEICYDGYLFKTTVEVAGYRGIPKHSSHPSAQAEEYQVHLENYIVALKENNIELTGLAYCYNYDSKEEPNVLFGESYKELLSRCPLYGKDQKKDLLLVLDNLLAGGKGLPVFDSFINSEVKPTKKLQDAAKNMFDGKFAGKEFALVGAQLDAYNEIMGAIQKTDKDNEKTVIVVKGGPGTGKSVIAFQLISGLAKQGGFSNIIYSTRSSSLIDGYKEILKGVNYKDGKDNSAIDLIKKNFTIKPQIYGENGIDALIVDEAHRIELSSNKDEDKEKKVQTHLPQILSMLFCSRVSVFFIDDYQSVKSIEIGTADRIIDNARNYKTYIEAENDKYLHFNGKKKDYWREHSYNDLPMLIKRQKEKVEELYVEGNSEKIRKAQNKLNSLEKELDYGLDWVKTANPQIEKVNIKVIELSDQFRCNGSNNYIDWIEHVLFKTERTKDVKLDLEKYEFGVFDTPQDLYAKIRSLDDFANYSDKREKELGDKFSYSLVNREAEGIDFNQTARLVAGWCWRWKQEATESNGDLLHEIQIPEHNFSMPWETSGRKAMGIYKDKYAPDAKVWIIDRRGVNQVGCIHSSQGWETDYIGVIIASDLKYDAKNDCLYGDEKVRNYDAKVKQKQPDFTRITKNIYRVLLTRGKKGCFIFACDPKVRDYFKRCLNQ